MPKKIISAFAHSWYPIYEIQEADPTCCFEVDVRVLKRWEKANADFDKVQEEIKAAQKKSGDMR